MCDQTDRHVTFLPFPANLAVSGNVTLNAGVGSHNLHLFMIKTNKIKNESGQDRLEIDKQISMHLSLEETEDLIKGLKHRLARCYEAKVEKL